jgi:hypothetical protein
MATIPVDKRLFHRKLRGPRGEKPEPKPEMTPDEMKVAEKALETAEKSVYEASKWLFNLSVAVKDPSPAQVEIFRGRVIDLRDEVEKMRLMFFR